MYWPSSCKKVEIRPQSFHHAFDFIVSVFKSIPIAPVPMAPAASADASEKQGWPDANRLNVFDQRRSAYDAKS